MDKLPFFANYCAAVFLIIIIEKLNLRRYKSILPGIKTV